MPIAVDLDGSAYVRSAAGLLAVDTLGEIRWTRPHRSDFHLGVAIDARGRLLVTPEVTLLDAATGEELWSVSIPLSNRGNVFSFPHSGVLGSHGVVLSDWGGFFTAVMDR